MNAELQKLRSHYDGLLPHAKNTETAQCLLKAIQIAEQLAQAVGKLRRWDFPDNEQPLWDELQTALARVTKKEGE